MAELPLITVIVAVYKVEKYLDQCVRSITEQTYRNLEIILVDDGSPDNCGAMCDVWAEKDSRIRVIHKKNGGLADARNAGIEAATGELIGFVDSDDWIEAEMFQMLYNQMRSANSDISSCGIVLFWDSGRPDAALTVKGTVILNAKAAMKAIIEESWIKQPVCNKLYKRNLISKLTFPVGKSHEDAFWTYQAVAQAQSVSVSDEMLYHYRQRDNSIMGSAYSLKRLDFIEAKRQMLAFLKENHSDLVDLALVHMLFDYIYAMEMSMQYLVGEEQRTAFRIIHSALKEILPVKPKREYGIKNNIWIILSQISFTGVCRLQLMLEKRKGKQ